MSTDSETCPRCGAHFPPRAALVSSGLVLVGGLLTVPGVSTRVRCPGCGNEFSAQSIRFFGFLTPRAMRIVVGLFVAAIVLGALYWLYVEPLLG